MLLAITLIVDCAYAWGPGYTRVNAAAETAETAYTNPAGMTRFDEKTTSLGAVLFHSFKEFEVDESLTTVDGGNPDSGDPVLIPAYYHIRPLGDNWRFGFSANLSGGFGDSSGSTWAGRYYSDEFTLAFVSLTPSLAYPVSEKLSLGVSVPVTMSHSVTTSRINSPGPDAPDGKLEGESTEFSPSRANSQIQPS